MLNIVPFGVAFLEKKNYFPIYQCKSLSPWGGGIYDPRDFI